MAAMAKSAPGSWGAFIKAILIPLFLAGLLYLILFHAIIPLYRRYRSHITRYSSYTPLNSSLAQQTTSIFAPLIIEPSRTLWGKAKERFRRWLWRWAVPGMTNMNLDGGQDLGLRTRDGDEWEEMNDPSSRLDYLHDSDPSRDSTPYLQSNLPRRADRTSSDDDEMEGGLFDAETGQSMVGFDVRGDDGDGRGFRLGRRRAESQLNRDERGRQFAREMMGDHHTGVGRGNTGYEQGRRLSRDLEQSFGDESDEEEEMEGVVVGR